MSERRLVQFYAGGKVKKSTKPKMTKETAGGPPMMAPAPGAPMFAGDGPAMKRGGKTKIKVKIKNKLAMGGTPDPMVGRMSTGLAARAPKRDGMPTFGGSPKPGGGAAMARQTVPAMVGALGRVR